MGSSCRQASRIKRESKDLAVDDEDREFEEDGSSARHEFENRVLPLDMSADSEYVVVGAHTVHANAQNIAAKDAAS